MSARPQWLLETHVQEFGDDMLDFVQECARWPLAHSRVRQGVDQRIRKARIRCGNVMPEPTQQSPHTRRGIALCTVICGAAAISAIVVPVNPCARKSVNEAAAIFSRFVCLIS